MIIHARKFLSDALWLNNPVYECITRALLHTSKMCVRALERIKRSIKREFEESKNLLKAVIFCATILRDLKNF